MKELLAKFTLKDIHRALQQYIYTTQIDKFDMIFGIIELEWSKIAKLRVLYDSSLEQLNYSWSEIARNSTDFFESFDLPVHP